MLNDLLVAHAAYDNEGNLIGIRLTATNSESSPASSTVLIWADKKMPGFRVGDGFIPSHGQQVEYRELVILPTGN